jgi:hypothetical protein
MRIFDEFGKDIGYLDSSGGGGLVSLILFIVFGLVFWMFRLIDMSILITLEGVVKLSKGDSTGWVNLIPILVICLSILVSVLFGVMFVTLL